MDMRETRISGEYFFEGRIMKARVDEVRLPNGKQASREVCEHVGGVGVLPIDRDGNILLVRQFRYPFDTETLEMPAGKMDHGPENAEECGVRELAEETGLHGRPASCRSARCIPRPAFLTEVTYLFAGARPDRGRDASGRGRIVETVRPADRGGGAADRGGQAARRKDHRGDVPRTAEKPVLRPVNHELLIV